MKPLAAAHLQITEAFSETPSSANTNKERRDRLIKGFGILVLTFTILLEIASAETTQRRVNGFVASGPKFDPMQFFTGHTSSHGVFENRAGDPTKVVRTETRSRLVNGELHMEQDLFVQGSPRQHRSWRMRRLDAHHFEATANDIVGTARGVASGNHFRWTFTLALKPGNPLFNVRMSQDMYLQPDGRTMINRTRIRKLGVVVAQVTEQFRRDNSPSGSRTRPRR